MGRSRYTRSCPVFGIKYLTNPFRVLLPGSNGHQGAGNISDHMVQKRIGLNINYDEFPFSGYVNCLEKTNGGSGLATCGTKGGKVVLSFQRLCGLVHCLRIQWPEGPADLAAQDTRSHRVIVDNVAISPVGC